MSFTVCENSSSSVAEAWVGGGAGVTLCDPFGCTAPIPSMLASVALLVCQVRVVDWPFSTVFGLAVSEAVGAAGGGGGGGGGGATFFLQAPSIMMAPKANTSIVNLSRRCITLVLRALRAH